MNDTVHIPRGPRALLATALVAVGTCTSVLALHGLIQAGPWLAAAWLSVLLVAAVVAGVRSVARTAWMPSLVGAIVALAGLLIRYGAPPGRIQVLPDLGSLRRTLATAHEGATVINASLVPMPPVRPAELLVVVGAVAVFLLADALAVALAVPALAGAAYATLWVPAIVLGFPASGWPLALTAIAYLLLLALSVTPTAASAATDRTRRISVAASAAIGVVIVSLVVGPAVAAFPGWASVALPDLGSGPVGPMRLSDDLDLRESLGQRSHQRVLTYTVTSPAAAVDDTVVPVPDATSPGPAASLPADGATPAPSASADTTPTVSAQLVGPLRAFTLVSFDGRQWAPPDNTAPVTRTEPGTILSPQAALAGTAPDASRGTLADVSLTVNALRDRHLPISTFPRTLDADGSWSYAASTDTVTGNRATSDGMQYAMVVEIPSLTADELKAAPTGDPGDDGASLEVPTTSHSEDIAAKAREVTASAKTPYEQALELQQFFRSTQNFTYDTRVAPARTEDAVWDFLQSRKGYCVQFASSMVLMARDLGIPARLAVGFLPGQSTGDGQTYTVTGHDSHAWPELYFAGYGWVRFEPTPAVQTGAPPIWSDPLSVGPSGPDRLDNVPQTGGAVTEGAGEDSTAATTAPPAQAEKSPWLAVVLTTVVVLLVAILVVVLVVRRQVRRGPELTPELAWARARRRLADAGVVWADSDTPRVAAASVRRQVEALSGRPLGQGADEALGSLAATIERERYSPRRPEVDAVTLDRWVVEVEAGVREALSERSRRDAVPSGPRAGS